MFSKLNSVCLNYFSFLMYLYSDHMALHSGHMYKSNQLLYKALFSTVLMAVFTSVICKIL